MKNLKFLKIASTFILLVLAGCGSDDKGELVYKGDSLLQFAKSTNEVFIVEGSGTLDVEIPYGVLKNAVGSHTVNLVPDAVNSTAILGTDYTIVSGSDELTSGEANGKFTIKLLEGPATLAGKTAVFTVSSSTLDSAVFNNSHALTIKLTCPVSETSFVGNYLIEELTPYVDGPTLDDGSVVTLSVIAGSTSGRTFMTKNYPNYCSPLRAFNFDLVCGEVIVRPNQASTCQCTAAGLFFGPAIVPGSYTIGNDSMFELAFTNDVTGNCGTAVQTRYRFTKQ